MIQSIVRYMHGYVRIRVEGESTERFLNLCCHHNIFIWGLKPCNMAYEMYVTIEGFRKLRAVIRKTHTKVTIVRRYGFPFFVFRNRKRKLFVPGFLLCLILLYVYSGFIWDIHFEGNETYTDEVLIEFLQQIEVYPAMLKKKVDCPQIVKEIREEYNDIVWVSVSVEGSRLFIHVKENEDTFLDEAPNTNQDQTPTDLVATTDGTITSIITRSGVPLVHAGDVVKKGDILVSGRIEVLNDAKEVIGYQYCQADADVWADTNLVYENTISQLYEEKLYQKKEQRILYYLTIGEYRFFVGSQAHPFDKWERSTQEYRLKLGENFYLPVSYGKVHIKSYQTKQKKYEKLALQKTLTEDFQLFCENLQEKGIQIRENSVKIYLNGNSASAQGILYLNQQITMPLDTEIIDTEIPERNEQDESIRSDD